MRALGVFLSLSVTTHLCAQDSVIPMQVDATKAPLRLFHVQMTMPVKAGPMTLLYPQWIPGEHGPTGPIADLVGLQIKAGDQTISWRRDSVDMYAFHLVVPPGATSIGVVFDFISPPETPGFSSGSSVTSELAVLNWNQFVLYRKAYRPNSCAIRPTSMFPLHGVTERRCPSRAALAITSSFNLRRSRP